MFRNKLLSTLNLTTLSFTSLSLTSLSLALMVLAMPALASAQDGNWQLRVSGVWVNPDIDFTDTSDGDQIQAGADSAIGLGLAFERRVSPRLGIEFGALSAEPDVNLDANFSGGPSLRASDGVSFTAITAGLNIHLTPDGAVDLYIGPFLGYILYGDVGFRAQLGGETLVQNFLADEDFALGAQIGANFAFGDGPWSVNLAAKMLDTSLEVTNDEGDETDLGFDPLILSVGFGYRF